METREIIRGALCERGLHPSLLNIDEEIDRFRSAMRRGLAGGDSPFAMYPTYLRSSGELPEGETVLVLDAGGTNLRIALVTFRDNAPVIRRQKKVPMPGSRGEITLDEYLSRMAEHLKPFLPGVSRVGFCFSYDARILPDLDGQLTCFNKEVKVSGSEGMTVCRALKEALAERGLPAGQRWVLLNDTAAACLGTMASLGAMPHDEGIGFILGTGTNTCYPEKTARIGRYDVRSDLPSMLVNMESGGYDGFPASPLDRKLDAESALPGNHPFEKMISGAYLGGLVTLALKELSAEGLLTGPLAEELSQGPAFTTEEVSTFLSEPLKTQTLRALPLETGDRIAVRETAAAVIGRAAVLSYIDLAAVLTEADLGKKKGLPAVVAAEGSTFWRTPGLSHKVNLLLKGHLNYHFRRHAVLRSCPESTLIGSAAAALWNS